MSDQVVAITCYTHSLVTWKRSMNERSSCFHFFVTLLLLLEPVTLALIDSARTSITQNSMALAGLDQCPPTMTYFHHISMPPRLLIILLPTTTVLTVEVPMLRIELRTKLHSGEKIGLKVISDLQSFRLSNLNRMHTSSLTHAFARKAARG